LLRPAELAVAVDAVVVELDESDEPSRLLLLALCLLRGDSSTISKLEMTRAACRVGRPAGTLSLLFASPGIPLAEEAAEAVEAAKLVSCSSDDVTMESCCRSASSSFGVPATAATGTSGWCRILKQWSGGGCGRIDSRRGGPAQPSS
jgi:hypothetical protein